MTNYTMTERPTVEKCAKTVYGGSWGGSLCVRKGVNLEGGEWWCKQHTPSLIKAKRAAASAAWQAKYESQRQEAAARHQETDERDRRAECFPDLVAALEGIRNQVTVYPDGNAFSRNQTVKTIDNIAEAAIAKAKT